VKLNGSEWAFTTDGSSIILRNVQVGVPHELELRKEGYQTKRVAIEIPAGNVDRIFSLGDVRMDRAVARLELKTDPPSVMLRVEGRAVAETDEAGMTTLDEIPVGVPVSVKFEKAGYKKRDLTLSIPAEYQNQTFLWKDMIRLDKHVKPVSAASDDGAPIRQSSSSQENKSEKVEESYERKTDGGVYKPPGYNPFNHWRYGHGWPLSDDKASGEQSSSSTEDK